MDQFMDDDDSVEEIEIGSEPEEFPDDLFTYGDPFAIPISSDESNRASIRNDTFGTEATSSKSVTSISLLNNSN